MVGERRKRELAAAEVGRLGAAGGLPLRSPLPRRPQLPDRYLGPLLVAPVVLVVVGISALPMAFSLWLVVHSYSPLRPAPAQFVGLDNLLLLLRDDRVWSALRVTATLALGGVGGSFLLGLALALLFNREGRLVRLARALALVPLMIMPIVVGLAFQMLFEYRIGLINYGLTLVGLGPVHWLDDPTNALVAVIIMDVWNTTPFVMLVLLAGLQGLPSEPFEAARVDGAGPLQLFRYLTLPLLRPLIVVVLLLRLIASFKLFDQIFTLTNAGPGNATETLAYYVYVLGFKQWDLGYAATVAYLLLAVLALASAFLLLRLGRDAQVEAS